MAQETSLKLSDFGVSVNRGFLPDEDPLSIMPCGWEFLDNFGQRLPELIQSGRLLHEANCLPVPPDYYFAFLTERELQLAWVRYSFIQSAYVHVQENSPRLICRNIARPMWLISQVLNKPPILSYDAYTLNNWKRRNPVGNIEVDNLELIQTFIRDSDQDWFILIHVDIENRAGFAVKSLVQAISAVEAEDAVSLGFALLGINIALSRVLDTMQRMPEGTSPETYYKIRPWIMSFENVIYGGVEEFDGQSQSFRGQTGAQTSIFQSLEAGLQMPKLEVNELATHLMDMRKYMPEGHRRFIAEVESRSQVRDFIIRAAPELADEYNCCVDRICDFLEIHFDYAVRYIHRQTKNPKGTGGTDFMKYLKGRLDERRQNAYIRI